MQSVDVGLIHSFMCLFSRGLGVIAVASNRIEGLDR